MKDDSQAEFDKFTLNINSKFRKLSKFTQGQLLLQFGLFDDILKGEILWLLPEFNLSILDY